MAKPSYYDDWLLDLSNLDIKNISYEIAPLVIPALLNYYLKINPGNQLDLIKLSQDPEYSKKLNLDWTINISADKYFIKINPPELELIIKIFDIHKNLDFQDITSKINGYISNQPEFSKTKLEILILDKADSPNLQDFISQFCPQNPVLVVKINPGPNISEYFRKNINSKINKIKDLFPPGTASFFS